MATWSVADFEEGYKERYPDGVSNYLAEQSKLISWFPSHTNGGAKPWKIVYGTAAVRGASNIDDALADRNTVDFDEAELDYAEEHVVVSVNMKLARRSAGDGAAIISAIEDAVDRMAQEFTLMFEHKLMSTGGGARGQIATGGISGTDITLADGSTAYLFSRNMKIQLSGNDGTGTSDTARSGTLIIQSIDPSPGNPVLTCTTNVTAGIPGATAGDYIFRNGDLDAGTQTTLQGVRAWSPSSTSGLGTAFFGLTRSNHVGALAGTRVTGSGQNVVDTIRDACAANTNNRGIETNNKSEAWLFINPQKMAEIEQAYGAISEYEVGTEYPGVTLKGLRVATGIGMVNFFQTSAMPEAESVLTSREGNWELGSIDELMHVVDDDGQTWRVEALQDAMQQRQRSYPQLGGHRLQDNTHVTW